MQPTINTTTPPDPGWAARLRLAIAAMVLAVPVGSALRPPEPEPVPAPSAPEVAVLAGLPDWVGVPAHGNSWIAFASSGTGGDRLLAVDPDGGELRVVARGAAVQQARAWSRDGRSLVRCTWLTPWRADPDSECPEERGVSRADLLASPPAAYIDTSPRLSPNAAQAAVVRVEDRSGAAELLVVDRLSGSRTILVGLAWDVDTSVDWSPDGTSIVFAARTGPGRRANVWTIRPDGTRLRRITDLGAGQRAYSPTFSPDGEWIAFRLDDQGSQLVRIRRDGTGQRVVLDDPELTPRNLDWGPLIG